MRKTHTPLQSFIQSRFVRTISFGVLCSMLAFVVGLETAGEVHPFDTSEAAVGGTSASATRASIKGDMDGDGKLEASDAARILAFADALETPTPEDIRFGDTDGDFRLTTKDVMRVLHALSVR